MKRHWLVSLMVCCLVLLVSRIGIPEFADSSPAVVHKAGEMSFFKGNSCIRTRSAKDSKCINSWKTARYTKAKRMGNIIVIRGDNLSCLSYKLYGNANLWRLMATANGISVKNPRFIYPGEKLIVPKLKSKCKKRVTGNLETQAYPINRNGENAESSGASGEKKDTESFEQSFEAEKISEKSISAESDNAAAFVEKKEKPQVEERKTQQLIGEVSKENDAVENKEGKVRFDADEAGKAKDVLSGGIGSKSESDAKIVGKKADMYPRHKFEMYVGAEKYHEAQGPRELEDHYWGSMHIRPIEYSLSEGIEGNIGVFGYGAGSHGFVSDRHGVEFEYGTREIAFGLSNKLYGKDWEAGTDIGVGRLWFDKGSRISESYVFQRDDSLYLSQTLIFRARRNSGLRSLPITEINFSLRKPLKTTIENYGTNQVDNSFVSGLIFQGIYDLNLWGDYYLTPGLNAGAGRDYRGGAEAFIMFGPGISLYYGNTPIFKIDVYNYKMNLGSDGRWYTFAGSLSLHGAWKAIYGALIDEVSPESVPTLYPDKNNDK